MKKALLLGVLLFSVCTLQISCTVGEPEIKWTTFQKVEKKQGQKMVFIELYTNWCGWCRRMENFTFVDPVVAKYMNKNFQSIQFNAEDRRAITFNGKQYKFNPKVTRRGQHELATALMRDSEKQGYPTVIFLDENYNLLQAIPGYITAKDFEAIMHYFGDGAYKTTKWEDFVLKYRIGEAQYSDVNKKSSGN